ncbi:MAG: DNA polymerase Y family protein [Gammaproteobacteria bacterium]|nr:DNA polymerase Y family protein [Gammaproteobacteria bacterium]
MPGLRKSPVAARGNATTPSASQQVLPFLEPASRIKPLVLTTAPPRRLWFCIWLPQLPLEACRVSENATAVVEEAHGIHRVLLADSKAQAAGIMAGQSTNAALALLPDLQLHERSPVREQQALEALAAWLEHFSSFVCIAEHDVLLLEIAGSLRLFGGLQKLREKISAGLRQHGFAASLAIAPTPLAATWLARAGRRVCVRDEKNIKSALRDLPLARLDWPEGLCAALTGMGVTTVGDCMRLPREGFVKRFGAQPMLALDRALGHLPDPRSAWRAPERFCADYEMTEEQSDRELLLRIGEELLLSLEQFLLARQLGTQRLSLSFFHLKGPATELWLGCARADRSAERWLELLRIRFEQLVLSEAVIAVRLQSGMTQGLQAESAHLNFHDAARSRPQRYSITQLAERLIARIGDQSVHSVNTVAEHRPQYAWRTQSLLSDWASGTLSEARLPVRRPLWMLPEPTLLPADSGYPLHQGCRLRLLHGPERLETGWWDDDGICRDYYTAVNPAGIRLWVFRSRTSSSAWYLHGYFG